MVEKSVRLGVKGRISFVGIRAVDVLSIYTRNHIHKECSLVDTIFNNVFVLDLQEHLFSGKNTGYP